MTAEREFPRIGRPVTGRDAAVFAGFAAAQLAGRFARHLVMKEEWFVLTRGSEGRYRRVQAPRNVYLADPWLFERDGRTYLFAEEFAYRVGRGSIVVGEVETDGRVGKLRSALERPYHLSYPCVFEFGDDVFMIPESRANRAVELYRATVFPHEWELDTVLFEDVLASDPTILVRDGRLWLFMTMSGDDQLLSAEELFVFFADRPRGPWRPHPQNPVVTDVRHARPAGAMFETGDALIRPSQDCLRGYGHAVILRRIERLSTEEYVESEAARITSHAVGFRARDVHTVARAGAVEAVDARRFRLRV